MIGKYEVKYLTFIVFWMLTVFSYKSVSFQALTEFSVLKPCLHEATDLSVLIQTFFFFFFGNLLFASNENVLKGK